ncbi:hypothetical protein GUJ93_ZPchr0010g7638 [Zizania palustris]|uniref:Uncharacterized protein n=1 Tax=Zizania palustris TaxID=103762 RepID=A0A8J5WD45_ZIZPA|nr:hypothetical protein GUJ93_ZPchr0010g7638 [Zizania palustris]
MAITSPTCSKPTTPNPNPTKLFAAFFHGAPPPRGRGRGHALRRRRGTGAWRFPHAGSQGAASGDPSGSAFGGGAGVSARPAPGDASAIFRPCAGPGCRCTAPTGHRASPGDPHPLSAGAVTGFDLQVSVRGPSDVSSAADLCARSLPRRRHRLGRRRSHRGVLLKSSPPASHRHYCS